jgi:hypothetical protein
MADALCQRMLASSTGAIRVAIYAFPRAHLGRLRSCIPNLDFTPYSEHRGMDPRTTVRFTRVFGYAFVALSIGETVRLV